MSFDDGKIRTGVSWVANDLEEHGETWLGLIPTTNGKTKIEELNIKQEGFLLFKLVNLFRAKSDKFNYFI